MSKKARYIVLDGIQGTGKTTQVRLLAEWLRSQGLSVHTTREPGGAHSLARNIRFFTQSPSYQLNTKAEVLLYNAARASSLDIVKNMLERNVWVISDRSFLTTLAMQYYARDENLDYDNINTICEFAVGDVKADLTLVFDLSPNAAKKRLSKRYQGERFDNLDTDFIKKAREGFLKEARKRSLPVIDASGSEDEVLKMVQNEVRKYL